MIYNSLISEDGKRVSMGRVSFWIILGISIYFWFQREPEKFPDTLFYILIIVLVYNLSKKMFRTFDKALETIMIKKVENIPILKKIVSEVEKVEIENKK